MGTRRSDQEQLAAARDALKRNAWSEALERLRVCARAAPLDVEDLDRLAEAALWSGELDEALGAWERVLSSHLERGNKEAAARAALRLAREYVSKGSLSVARGWYQRAKRLLADAPEGVAHGYLADAEWFAAIWRSEFEGARGCAERMVDLGTRFEDPNLLALGLNRQGHALVLLGEVEDGLALIEEATVPAVAGELDTYTTFVVYCATVGVCRELADYGRAGEWAQAARRWCERRTISGFPGICRIYTAEALRLRGAWREAEEDARRACDELERIGAHRNAGAGFIELGEIRLRLGDIDGAERAFCTAHEMGRDPQPGLALVRLAQGRIDEAAAAIAEALDESPDDRLTRARLLPAQVEIALVVGDVETAARAGEQLGEIAADFGTDGLRAQAAFAAGSVAIARGDARSAAASAREAIRRWQAIEFPYEVDRARVLLSDALAADGDDAAAGLERQAARAAFVRLGAARDIAALAAPADESVERLASGAVTRTFMFTDVVGSTDLIAAIGDEAWVDARSWHDAALRDLFAAHGGEEVNHTGDGFFVAFASVQHAIDCAVAIQHALERHRREHGFALPVRIGLHSGDATPSRDGYAGRGVHICARIGALAASGEILASQTTLTQTSARVARGEAWRVDLKGISEPVEVATIDWRQTAG